MTLQFSPVIGFILIVLLSQALALAALGLILIVFYRPAVSKIGVPAALIRLGLRLKQLIQQPLWPAKAQGEVRKRYTWEFPLRALAWQQVSPVRFFIELPVSQARYIEYRQRPRELNARHFNTYVTVSLPEIELLADQLLKLGQTHGYSAYDQLCNALAFVQQGIHYTADLCPQTGQIIEYPKYPIETLLEKRGDCEDQAILAAALLKRMGYEVALLVLPTHVALGVAGFHGMPGSHAIHPASGIRYLYTETTAKNWLPGEVPPEFRPYLASGQFEVLPVTLQEAT